jgi:SET domain-containing protein
VFGFHFASNVKPFLLSVQGSKLQEYNQDKSTPEALRVFSLIPITTSETSGTITIVQSQSRVYELLAIPAGARG